jgi:rubrerythrin
MYQDPGFCEYRLNERLSAGERQPVLVMEPTKSSEAYRGMNTGPQNSCEAFWGVNTYEDQYDINTNLPYALRIIEEAAEGEAKERSFYRHLIGVAMGEDKEIISGISGDAARHHELLRRIYYEITNGILSGSDAEPAEKPASYPAGLQKALMAAQEAAVKYRKVLFAMRSSRHINMLTEIITDELRHVGVYNFLYAKHMCAGK